MGLLDALPGDENCGTCHFWHPYTDDGVGQCRRHAPVLHNGIGEWPLTTGDITCGDWAQAIQGLDD